MATSTSDIDKLSKNNEAKVPSSERERKLCNINCECHNKFVRQSIDDVVRWELNDVEFRRMYKMTYPDFKTLCEIITPYYNHVLCSNTLRRWKPNDRKTIEVRVACAIRHFAGDMDFSYTYIHGVTRLFYNESVELLKEALIENDSPELRHNYKRLFVITGLNPKSKAKLKAPQLRIYLPGRYCFDERK